MATKPILIPPAQSSCSLANDGSDKIAQSHVGNSIVDNLYIVGGSIGISITDSKIRNYDRVCISIDVSLVLFVTL